MVSFHADFIPRSPRAKILLHRSSFLPLKNRKALAKYMHTRPSRRPCSSIEAAKAGEE